MNVRLAFAGFDDEGSSSSSSDVVPAAKDGVWFRDDFVNKLDSSFQTSAGGTHSAVGSGPGANHLGVITETVTAVADATRIVPENAALATLFLGGGELYIEFAFQMPTRSDGVNNAVLRYGLGDVTGTGDFTDGVYLEYDFATHGDHNFRLCCANNTARTKTDTGIALVAATWYRCRITVNAGATSVSATINDVAAAAPVTTNIPAAAARTCGPEFSTVKQLGAGALTALIDYWELRQLFTAAR